jgi:protein-disulfide isomerase
MKAESLGTVVTSALACCAIVLTTVNGRRFLFPSRSDLTQPAAVVANWAQYAGSGHRIGSPNARVTIVAFSDYRCSACQLFNRRVTSLLARYPSDLSVVWRHYPLGESDLALAPARAAVCAEVAGRFAAYHALLFTAPTDTQYVALAVRAAIRDTSSFTRCINGPSARQRVESDIATGRSLGFAATPTLLINGAEYPGLPEDLERIVQAAVRQVGRDK